MTTISSYTTQSGVRYRVRYRKPDGSQPDKRGFRRKRDAEQWAAEHVTTAKAQGSFIDPQDAKITVGEMAEAWLAEQERLIKLGSWEPPRIEKTKELSSTITFREYALDFVQNRRKPNGQRIAPTTREKYLQYLDDYLLPVLGDKPMGSIGPRDIEKWADRIKSEDSIKTR